jgi:hypothetical protein
LQLWQSYQIVIERRKLWTLGRQVHAESYRPGIKKLVLQRNRMTEAANMDCDGDVLSTQGHGLKIQFSICFRCDFSFRHDSNRGLTENIMRQIVGGIDS